MKRVALVLLLTVSLSFGEASKEEIKEVVNTLKMVNWYLKVYQPHNLFGIPKKTDVEKLREVLLRWEDKLRE